MKIGNRNIRIIPENNLRCGGFDVYLEFSGQREYLMWHRHNGILYDILKSGIRLDDLWRMLQKKPACKSRIRYLLTVIDEYLDDRACA